METTQGISLHRYLYLKLAKTPCLSLSFMVFFGEQQGGTSSESMGVGTSVGREVAGKGVGG
jgi:hypothetical protein